ncbi:hypothetical protein NDU88_005820 [Pleurodeles waltl]|uniref:Uncharacterized protein n=1 Tax=Pleurodeles waltl TaxID=8319 RepID=A0AAV7L572_PLEWA|nr:hypothetical protein NDU88_005820 [Pleurodeles waltl]
MCLIIGGKEKRSPPRLRATPLSRLKSAPGVPSGETAHPEVLPDLDIRVEDAETVEEGEPERKGSLEPEEGKGAEPGEKGREESEE